MLLLPYTQNEGIGKEVIKSNKRVKNVNTCLKIRKHGVKKTDLETSSILYFFFSATVFSLYAISIQTIKTPFRQKSLNWCGDTNKTLTGFKKFRYPTHRSTFLYWPGSTFDIGQEKENQTKMPEVHTSRCRDSMWAMLSQRSSHSCHNFKQITPSSAISWYFTSEPMLLHMLGTYSRVCLLGKAESWGVCWWAEPGPQAGAFPQPGSMAGTLTGALFVLDFPKASLPICSPSCSFWLDCSWHPWRRWLPASSCCQGAFT